MYYEESLADMLVKKGVSKNLAGKIASTVFANPTRFNDYSTRMESDISRVVNIVNLGRGFKKWR